jgi:hypothetical protein
VIRSLRATFAEARATLLSPDQALPLALLRVALGVLLLWSTLQLLSSWDLYFGRTGVVPQRSLDAVLAKDAKLLFRLTTDVTWQKALSFAALVPMATFTLGILPRLSALVSFWFLLSLQLRAPILLDGADLVLRALLFLFIFAKSDGALAPFSSLRRPDSAAGLVVLALRAQVALIYLATALAKLEGSLWQDGSAIAYVLRLTSFTRADWVALSDNPWLVAALTWGTLAFELSFAFLVWNRRLRPLVLGAGLLFHLGIELVMYVPVFPAVMAASYLVFIPGDVARRFHHAWLEKLAHSSSPLALRVFVHDDGVAHALRLLDSARVLSFEQGLPTSGGVDGLVTFDAAGRERRDSAAWRSVARRLPSLWWVAPLLAVPPLRRVLCRVLSWRARRLTAGLSAAPTEASA